MIPLGPQDINKTARLVNDADNLGLLLRNAAGGPWTDNAEGIARRREEARASDRYRSYSKGEVVRIKGYRMPSGVFGSQRNPDLGLSTVLIKPLDGDTSRAFYTQAHNLDVIEDTRTEDEILNDAGIYRDPATGNFLRVTGRYDVAAPPLEAMTRLKAKRLEYAHTNVAAAYRVLKNALDALKEAEQS